MDLVSPFEKVDAEAVDSFSDASMYLLSMLHSDKLQIGSHSVEFLQGEALCDYLIDLLCAAEDPVGADQILILMPTLLYYRFQKHCRPAMEIEGNSTNGYFGRLLGHRFFAHARIRPSTLIVAAKQGPLSKVYVYAHSKWAEGDPLFT